MGDAGNSYGCKRRSHHSSAMDHSASFMLCPVPRLLARTRWQTSRSARCVRSSGKPESGDMLLPHRATLTAVLGEQYLQSVGPRQG
jgi:hypothetical protein